MRLIITYLYTILPIFIFAQNYTAENIQLLSRWDGAGNATGWAGNRYSSLKGFTKDNKKYAIIGSANGTHFIDISNPILPVELDYVAGALQNCTWREYEVKNNICYAISDDSGNNTFQIIDMQYLPDSVHVVHNEASIFQRAHTIYIDGNRLYCAGVSNNSGYSSVNVYDITNPATPVLLREINQDYPNLFSQAHDMLVKNDTVYVSAGNSGLYIFKFNSNNTFTLIGTLTSYISQGYNHNTALMPDGKTLIITDEVPKKLKVKSIDISNMNDIVLKDTFQSAYGNTPHNAYNAGINNRCLIAYYEDGVQIFDCSNPSNVQCTGFFDTHFQTPGAALGNYAGAWGAYIFPDDYTVIASDMQNGLYVLDARAALGINTAIPTNINSKFSIKIAPNLIQHNFFLSIQANTNTKTFIDIVDINGRNVYSEAFYLIKGENKMEMNFDDKPAGMYFLSIQSGETIISQKFIKQ